MLDEIVIAPPLCGNLVVKHLERRRLYLLIRILRNRALVLYPRSLRDNRTNLRHDILRLAFQDLTILLGYRIYLTTDINKVYAAATGIVNELGKYIKKNIISQSYLKTEHETDTY